MCVLQDKGMERQTVKIVCRPIVYLLVYLLVCPVVLLQVRALPIEACFAFVKGSMSIFARLSLPD